MHHKKPKLWSKRIQQKKCNLYITKKIHLEEKYISRSFDGTEQKAKTVQVNAQVTDVGFIITMFVIQQIYLMNVIKEYA